MNDTRDSQRREKKIVAMAIAIMMASGIGDFSPTSASAAEAPPIASVRSWLTSNDPEHWKAAAEVLSGNSEMAVDLLPELVGRARFPHLDPPLNAALTVASSETLFDLLPRNPTRVDLVLDTIRTRVRTPLAASLAIDPTTAAEEVAGYVFTTDDPRAWVAGLACWRSIVDAEAEIPKPLLDLIFGKMLGDDANVGPSEKIHKSPQGVAISVLTMDPDKHEAQLLEALTHEDPIHRSGAVRVFAQRAAVSEKASDRLLAMMTSESAPRVQADLADALGRLTVRCDESAALLIDALDQPHNISGSASRSIASLAPHLSEELRSRAADALYEHQLDPSAQSPRLAIIALRRLIANLPEGQRRRLANGMIPLAARKDQLVDDRLSAIAEAGPVAMAALPMLREEMAAADPEDRARLAGFLWSIEQNPESVLPIFTAAIRSDSSIERHYGWEGFEAMGEDARPAIADIVAQLSAEKSGTRISALRCLADLGPVAREALPAIRKLPLPERESEREAIDAAIAAIETSR